MGCGCTSCGFSPCRCCNDDFAVLSGAEYQRSLVFSLTPCVDQIRNIYTCLGARAYQVALIWTRWSGGERGVGIEEVIRREMILPTPLVADLSALQANLQPIGLDEVGSLKVSEISPRYNEDFLVGRAATGAEIPEDQNFFWEITFTRPPGTLGPRRRFTPKSAPNYDPLNFQWSILLLKASEDRARNGDLL